MPPKCHKSILSLLRIPQFQSHPSSSHLIHLSSHSAPLSGTEGHGNVSREGERWSQQTPPLALPLPRPGLQPCFINLSVERPADKPDTDTDTKLKTVRASESEFAFGCGFGFGFSILAVAPAMRSNVCPALSRCLVEAPLLPPFFSPSHVPPFSFSVASSHYLSLSPAVAPSLGFNAIA